jgi:hypothetical protein
VGRSPAPGEQALTDAEDFHDVPVHWHDEAGISGLASHEHGSAASRERGFTIRRVQDHEPFLRSTVTRGLHPRPGPRVGRRSFSRPLLPKVRSSGSRAPTDATQLHGSDRSPQRRPLDQFDEDDDFGPTTLMDGYDATLAETWLGVPAGDLLPGSPTPSSRKPQSHLAIGDSA